MTVAPEDHLDMASADGEFAVAIDSEETESTYIRSTPVGGQILFAASEAHDGRFAVEFTDGIAEVIPAGAELIVRLGTGQAIQLEAPWAVDANGDTLATTYAVEGNFVVQNVAVSAATAYPIVADPNWTYLMEFTINRSLPFIMERMTNRFGYFFGVPGAPATLPAINQYVPLRLPTSAGPWNFDCYMNGSVYEAIDGGASWSFSFRSGANHVDGLGSNIIWRFISTSGDLTTMFVFASIANQNPLGFSQEFYKNAAWTGWAGTAGRLGRGVKWR